ncbi:MAG: primosomal protein N', partial [Gammaproteobacteria bacterium]|nr:primosomal protein N' [Gammaproteobacteria bacterium]
MNERIIQVALPVRLRRLFDYRLGDADSMPPIGARVFVPLQKRKVVGVVCGTPSGSSLHPAKLREISKVLDPEPVIPPELFELLLWAARYYHHPIGDVMQAALPVALRRDRSMEPVRRQHVRILAAGRRALDELPPRSRRQRHLLETLIRADSSGVSRQDMGR